MEEQRSTKYVAGLSFHSRLTRAKQFAETRRVQGSRWTIERWPCCVLVSDGFSLVVTEINTDKPLFQPAIDNNTIENPSLLKVARLCAPDSPDSIIRLLTVGKGIKRWDGGFLQYRSSSHGGSSKLNWTLLAIKPRYNQLEASYVERFAARTGAHTRLDSRVSSSSAKGRLSSVSQT